MRPRNFRTFMSENGSTGLPKCPTGIHGLDEITFGGLPRGRPTLVCGGAGCGKTLLGMEFLVRGATEFNEPGVCLSFEETAEELTKNVSSLGFDVAALVAKKKLAIDHVYIERSLIEEAGEYDLEALFVRLGHAVDSIGAKRVLIDSVEALFAGLENESVSASRACGVCSAGSRKEGSPPSSPANAGKARLTRHGLEEYISDCVILLDHHVAETVLTRRLRDRQVPRLHARDQRVSLPDRERRHFRAAGDLDRAEACRLHASGFPRAFPLWTPCSAARATFGAAAFWCPERPAPGRPA